MKKFLFLTIAFFGLQLVDAQEQILQSQDSIYNFKDVDVKPEYPGGMEGFYKFIAKNFKIPDEEGLKGKILTTFVIEIDGSLGDIKVLQDIGFGTGIEAVRVLVMSQKWIPAKLNGVPVRVLYQFPISISTGH